MKVFADTSVLVAAMVKAHPHHARAFPWLSKARQHSIELVVATHTLAELYAVLTSLPVQPRIAPGAARRLIRADIEEMASVVALSKSDYVAVLDTMSELGLSGGVIYDALAARVAARARAEKLLTLNPRDFRRVWPEGDAIICEP